MNSFWEESWKAVDPKRITDYIGGFAMEPDAVMERLRSENVKTVCDAGCGCGIYALKLAVNGFTVSGFDVSAHAVKIAEELLEQAGAAAELKTASILSTGYPDGSFDAVVSRDVLDHMTKADAKAAVEELYRITRPGGMVLFTLDPLDEEYEEEPHTVNGDGDFLFTGGKWTGMVFHPYTSREVRELIPAGAAFHLEDREGELTVQLRKLR